MGLLFSVILSYAGALEAMEVLKHILAGMLPDSDPDFSELAAHYTRLLNRASSGEKDNHWGGGGGGGQGYLCLVENEDGSLRSASIKYYDGSEPDSAAILFSTKISSFGQDSTDSTANGDYGSSKTERYTTSTTKTLLTNTSESINVGQRNRSTTPSYENVSDPTHFSENSFGRNRDSVSQDKSQDEHSRGDDELSIGDRSEKSNSKEKLTWHYRPRSPIPQSLPEIHLQQSEGAEKKDPAYSEDFLRSLDGIKYRPMQRSDPTNRRRSYKKRHSSSSTSSRESRASREEELKIFTSLEEAEFERMNDQQGAPAFGSTPNLAAHSHSRSRSRENSKERRTDTWSVEGSLDSAAEGEAGAGELRPRLKDLPKLGSFEERAEEAEHPDELIFSGEYTKAMNKDWHSGHFCCWQCDESLTGQRYVLRDDHPYCIKCYESVFANGCEECSKTIGIDSKDLSYKDKHWHEACFLCAKCRVSLVDKQFGSKLDKIYCGNCYDAQFASRCDGCGEVFRAGTKKMEYKTRQWHEKCFCCVVCKNAIGTKSFIPREQEIYCAGCYEDKFATRCVKCNKIITQGGVTYKNEPWHRECFTCTNCSTSLAGQRFTSRDEKPYCAECFGELFAKRCTSCTKPITGIGGTRFISFEDRHWHNDCFICAQCKTSLVGKGFITDGQDIICPECAKQKLM
ncbi:paxillin isoform X4 [Plutella xylostella]|uniref:paxillin isoform X4 n=1 Tax=Plutella xylostella TaxID=51655 RepID=UPI00203300E8|nr:paxillin isoform X4 [Plutella xylostella]